MQKIIISIKKDQKVKPIGKLIGECQSEKVNQVVLLRCTKQSWVW